MLTYFERSTANRLCAAMRDPATIPREKVNAIPDVVGLRFGRHEKSPVAGGTTGMPLRKPGFPAS